MSASVGTPGCVAHCFWSSKDPCTWGASADLPVAQQIGLFSAVRAANLNVTLWTYHPALTGFPPGRLMDAAAVGEGDVQAAWGQEVGTCVVRDAADVWPAADARAFLARAGRIQHVADFVRFEAAYRWPGAAVGAGDGVDGRWCRAEPGAWSPKRRPPSSQPRGKSPEPRGQRPEPRFQTPAHRAQSPGPTVAQRALSAESPEARSQSLH